MGVFDMNNPKIIFRVVSIILSITAAIYISGCTAPAKPGDVHCYGTTFGGLANGCTTVE